MTAEEDVARILELVKDADISCENMVFDWCGHCGSCNLARFLTAIANRQAEGSPQP